MVMVDLLEYVKIRYLLQTPNTTLVQTSISTDSILQLTGDVQRPIHIFVEDKLSQAIINEICSGLNCKRFVQTFLFGPAINAFTVIAGKVLNAELDDKMVVVMDGDVYVSEQDKIDRIKEVITGQAYITQRDEVLHAILQYNLPQQQKPELFIRNGVLSLSREILPDQHEFRIVLNEIGVVEDDHKYIDDAIGRILLHLCVLG
jgi:hypothetical protein